jgi:hypothetical protein
MTVCGKWCVWFILFHTRDQVYEIDSIISNFIDEDIVVQESWVSDPSYLQTNGKCHLLKVSRHYWPDPVGRKGLEGAGELEIWDLNPMGGFIPQVLPVD